MPIARPLALVSSLALLTATAGCDLYFNDDDCYEVCEPWGAPGDSGQSLRNPDTGQCEIWGGGYDVPEGGGCYEVCDGNPIAYPTRAGVESATEPYPDWPACYSGCEGMDEDSCQDTPTCQAVYLEGRAGTNYYDCWAVNDWGGSGDCDNLDSWTCSGRDDCSRVHTHADAGGGNLTDPEVGSFVRCTDESGTPDGCYTDADCGNGYDCTAETECLEPPGCNTGGDCPAVCYGRCVADKPWGTCDDASCERVAPACPAGTVPGVKNGCYTDYCIPDGLQCGDEGPAGQCFVEPSCDSVGPNCPIGTLAGVANGCYTGFCVPYSGCEPAPACSSLNSESKCLAGDTCVPYYQGVDCTCSGNACTCEDYDFVSCN